MKKYLLVLFVLLIPHAPSLAEACDGNIYEKDSDFPKGYGVKKIGTLNVEEFYMRLAGEADWQRCRWRKKSDDKNIDWMCGNRALSEIDKYIGHLRHLQTGYILSKDRKGFFLFYKGKKLYEKSGVCKVIANYPIPRSETSFPTAAVEPHESAYRYEIKDSNKMIELKLITTYATPVVKLKFR